MPANLDPVTRRPDMVSVMDHPHGKPENFLLQLTQGFDLVLRLYQAHYDLLKTDDFGRTMGSA